MLRSKVFWGSLIVLFVALAYVLPYTLFSGVEMWYGSFLWWALTAFFTIVFNFFLTRDWR